MIGFVILFGILLVFIGLNLENRCDISFGFTTIEAVPIYLTAFSAFVAGMLCTIPLIVSLRFRKPQPPGSLEAKPSRRRRGRKKGGKEPAPAEAAEGGNFSQGGPYGID
ncbi:MAG: hypothetical protein LBU28_01655 [Spirochaetaceae bacterium]|jgi:hypothetical protein|nr:hypothetical protein [Spirochaetaceae bacterium]